MSIDKLTTTPNADEELDDPYIYTVTTEEFVKTVEQDSQQEKDD